MGVHFPPLDLLSLAAYLEGEGYHPEVKDLCVDKYSTGDIRFRDYDVVGIGTDTTRFSNAQHLVFKHDHISFIRLQWLLLKANFLYYSRSRKGRTDIFNLVKRHRLGVGTAFHFVKDYFIG